MIPSRLGRSLCALSLASIAALSGCYKGDDQVSLQKDGSGTLVQTATIDKDKLEQLKGLVTMMGAGLTGGMDGGGEPDPSQEIAVKVDEFFSADDVKARMKGVEGVELKRVDRSEKDGKTNVRIEMAFQNLEAAAKAGMFSIFSVDLVKNADVDVTTPEGKAVRLSCYTLKFDAGFGMPEAPPAPPAPPGPTTPPEPGMEGGKPVAPPAAPPIPAGMDLSGIMAMLEPIVGGIEMQRTLTVPGTVSETNGVKTPAEGGTTVTWTVGFKDLAAGKKITQSATFEGEGLNLKPFSHKPSFAAILKRYLNIGTPDDAGDKPPPPPAVTPTTPEAGMDPR